MKALMPVLLLTLGGCNVSPGSACQSLSGYLMQIHKQAPMITRVTANRTIQRRYGSNQLIADYGLMQVKAIYSSDTLLALNPPIEQPQRYIHNCIAYVNLKT